jgi:hypothetical protein
MMGSRLPKPSLRAVGCALVTTVIATFASAQSPTLLAGQPATREPVINARWSRLAAEFEEGYFKLEPSFAVVEGRHEFDGQLPDWSAAALAHEVEWLDSERSRVAACPAKELSAVEQLERRYLLAVIDGCLFWLREANWPYVNPAYYVGTLDPDVYLSRPYAPLEARLQAFIAYAKHIPTAARQIRANLRSPLPRTYVTFAVDGFGGFADFYRKDVLAVFAPIASPRLQAELRAAIEPAAQAMEQLTAWFKGRQSAAGSESFALGAGHHPAGATGRRRTGRLAAQSGGAERRVRSARTQGHDRGLCRPHAPSQTRGWHHRRRHRAAQGPAEVRRRPQAGDDPER